MAAVFCIIQPTATEQWGILTHPGLKIMADILQINAFTWKTFFVFWLKFHWSIFLMFGLTISQYWFRWKFGAKQAHYMKQCWPSWVVYICQEVFWCWNLCWIQTEIQFIHLKLTDSYHLWCNICRNFGCDFCQHFLKTFYHYFSWPIGGFDSMWKSDEGVVGYK